MRFVGCDEQFGYGGIGTGDGVELGARIEVP